MSGRRLIRLLGILFALLVVYYVAPWPGGDNEVPNWIGWVLVSAGVVALAAVCLWQLSLFLRAGPGSDLRLQSLVVLLECVVFFFATTYFLVAQREGNFVGLETRTDALYFTLTTVTTTGFGDINAASEGARFLVTVHMVFNLVFVAAIASTIAAQFKQRVARNHPPEAQ